MKYFPSVTVVRDLVNEMAEKMIEINDEVLEAGVACLTGTVKPVLSGHSKIDKIKVLTTNGSLMEVESIAECSLGAFCNTFDLH